MPKIIFTAVLVVVAGLLGADPAGAGKVKVDLNGAGTYVIRNDGSAALAGTASGEPYDGSYEAALTPADGTLPEAGTCEPATASLRVAGAHQRFVELTAGGRVCGQYLQPPNIVTHVFTGRYGITAASRRPLVGTDGFLEVRLVVDGRASVFAIDT
jgi:hypothetical protein